MSGVFQKVPLGYRFFVLNLAMLLYFAFTGRLCNDWASIIGLVVALTVMNLVAWISSRHYKEWK